MRNIPVIDVSPLVTGNGNVESVAREIGRACREHGFFYIRGHGVDEELQRQLEELSRLFFAQDIKEKMSIRMALGGSAWRGYFPVGEELTSGKPDVKEGIYFGAELGEDDARVRAGMPMHGRNLFPDYPPEFRETVLAYMTTLKELGQALMRGIALSLGLESRYFADRYMSDPLVLFRIFHYPPIAQTDDETSPWSVGEHTDYGVLTILKQDALGGLQIKSKGEWITAHPVPNTFVCNIGDMLDRMTGGLYRSTPHRVRNVNPVGRLSFPFFFDPGFEAEIEPIEFVDTRKIEDDQAQRWDRASVHAFQGTYGEYLLEKVGRVFPDLTSEAVYGRPAGHHGPRSGRE